MPYYEKTLRDLINEGITGENILKYSLLLLEALEFAHAKGVWHRDIKPENILCDPDSDSLVLADFGIAHFEQELLYTYVETKDERVANFQYAAWEQKTPGQLVDGRADLYAFGLILNEMFTNKVIHGTSFVKIGDSQPEFGFLDSFVDILTKQLPKDRPSSASAVKTELLARINLASSEKAIALLTQSKSEETRTIRDNIYNDPIRIETVNFVHPNLVFKLNQGINEDWIQLFNEVSNAARVKEMGYPWYLPERDTILFQITGDQNYQKITDDLKLIVGNTNLRYKNMIDDQYKEWQISERKKIEDRILKERKKQDILKSIRL
jgi:serine/threonine protein kinase